MSTTEGTSCICSKPAANRCSACKIVSYCSAKCQRADWKTHKTQCKTASQGGATGSRVPQVGSSTQLSELVRIGAQYTIYDDCMALGLNPDLISGASGEEFYQDKDGAGNFWRLDAPVREHNGRQRLKCTTANLSAFGRHICLRLDANGLMSCSTPYST
ncbi:hypothetical protein B0H16DRAFT_104757 [Mycena metata]|uniref:MYND-type domain-containing protein n=1 Tax=Mycena metata TaxID=1033252 RepID=A0AAD7IAK2_9AGAR|nr:hypothetical protein B0H16DRAFT_104757 [Mycena metata]